jgi:hypothetical protein
MREAAENDHPQLKLRAHRFWILNSGFITQSSLLIANLNSCSLSQLGDVSCDGLLTDHPPVLRQYLLANCLKRRNDRLLLGVQDQHVITDPGTHWIADLPWLQG